MDDVPPKGSGRPLVLIGLERCAVKAVFGNVELAPMLLLLFLLLLALVVELFDNLNLFEEMAVDEFDGVPVSLFLEEW